MASRWVTIAGDFPPTLNKDSPPTELKPNETPAGYGFDVDKPGLLAAGTIPTGTARAVTYGTGSYTAYPIYYNRLWTASSKTLIWGAPDYSASFYRQGFGEVVFPDITSILTYFPVGDADMAVFGAEGAYLLANAAGPSGRYERGHLVQELAVAAANQVTELNGIAYVCNASGLFAWDGRRIEELTQPVRNNSTGFTNTAVLCDYAKRRIIGTSKFVYDTVTKRLFDFNTSGFLYTTPTITADQQRPLHVEKLAFLVEHAATTGGDIIMQAKAEDNAWGAAQTVHVPYESGYYSRVEFAPDDLLSAHRLAFRVTSLPTALRLREVQVYVDQKLHGDNSE